MKNLYLLFFGFLNCWTIHAQSITERLILTDTENSLYLHADRFSFDRDGNYYFIIEKDDQQYFITKEDTIGGFKFIGSTTGSNGDINYTCSYLDTSDLPYFYMNANGIKIFGNAIGKIEDFYTSCTMDNVALTTKLNDTFYYYINEKLVSQNVEQNRDWITFSENGNVIYSLKHDSLYYLYVNDTIADSSKFDYTKLFVNNNGAYIYAKGKKPDQPLGDYDYMFFIHSQDTILGYVRTAWESELKENGAYYYSGDDNGPEYIVINDKLHKNINSISNITLINKKTYLYSFEENGTNKINVNGNIYSHKFKEIFFPSLDTNGNFAFYGLKNYYIYKFINGKKEKKPISRYGIRPTPIYISPEGRSLYYFKTDDSIYVYLDDNLLFKPISDNSPFLIETQDEFLPHKFVRGKTNNGNSLFYLEYDKNGYLVFNGKFSIPLLPTPGKSYSTSELGDIVTGEFNDNGFFAIQKTGDKKFLIVINNEVYKELEGVDYIIEDCYFFDRKELTFYGVKDLSFYQFKLSL